MNDITWRYVNEDFGYYQLYFKSMRPQYKTIFGNRYYCYDFYHSLKQNLFKSTRLDMLLPEKFFGFIDSKYSVEPRGYYHFSSIKLMKMYLITLFYQDLQTSRVRF